MHRGDKNFVNKMHPSRADHPVDFDFDWIDNKIAACTLVIIIIWNKIYDKFRNKIRHEAKNLSRSRN